MEYEEKRDREHRGELSDEAGRLHGDVLERPDQVPEQLRQATRVVDQLRADVVVVVVVPKRAVVAEIRCVPGRVMRDLLHLLDQARDDDVADDDDAHDQDQVDDQDDERPRCTGTVVDRVDHRQQGERHEQADRNEPDYLPNPPDEIQDDRARGDHQDDPDHTAQRRRGDANQPCPRRRGRFARRLSRRLDCRSSVGACR